MNLKMCKSTLCLGCSLTQRAQSKIVDQNFSDRKERVRCKCLFTRSDKWSCAKQILSNQKSCKLLHSQRAGTSWQPNTYETLKITYVLFSKPLSIGHQEDSEGEEKSFMKCSGKTLVNKPVDLCLLLFSEFCMLTNISRKNYFLVNTEKNWVKLWV